MSDPLSEWSLFVKRLGKNGLVRELVKDRAAEVVIGTTDPDFDAQFVNLPVETGFAQKAVRFRVELPPGYPEVEPKVTVLTKHPIKPFLQQQITAFLDANKGQPVLRNLVKWIDRKIAEWKPEETTAQEKHGGDDDGDSTKQGTQEKEQDDGDSATQGTQEKEQDNDHASKHVGDHESTKQSTQDEDLPQNWSFNEQIALENALRKYPTTMNKHTRWRKIGASVKGKTKRECIERFLRIRDKLRAEMGPEMPQQEGGEEEEEDLQVYDEVVPPPKKGKKPEEDDDIWTEEQQAALDEALAKFPASMDKNERWSSIARVVPGKSKRQCVSRFKFIRNQLLDSKKEPNEEEEEEEEGLPDLNPHEHGLLGHLTDLNMKGIGWCYVKALEIHCSCEMCGKDFSCAVEHGVPFKKWCQSCSSALHVEFSPLLIHNESQGKVGYFDLGHTVVQDLIKCTEMKWGCFECSSVTTIHNVERVRPVDASCRKCHLKMRLSFQSWASEYVENSSSSHHPVVKHGASGGGKGSGPKPRRVPRDPRIVLGKPLPDEGTCKHYKHSHRWLRFPCCGMAFPCDVCHDEKSTCEETKWATRQICGYCCFEQAYSNDKPCLKCGKVIGNRKPTRHWEGGKGCRDKTLMSNKDSKKHTNSNLKTHSRKSERVGPKPK